MAKSDPTDHTRRPESGVPLFDRYAASYAQELEKAIAFSGQDADFFVEAKAAVLCDLITEKIGSPAGVRLLDVGCGTGTIHRKLFNAGLVVTGVDVASGPVAIARQANPFAHYEVFDDGKLPFADAGFDVVIAVCVLHHVPAQNQREIVSEMCRVTRKGGVVALIEHNPVNPLTRYAVSRCPFDEDAVLLTASRSRALLEAVVGNAATRYFLFLPLRRRWVFALERRLAWLGLGAQYCAYAINEKVRAPDG